MKLFRNLLQRSVQTDSCTVSRADVYMLYRVFLHREPESEEVIEACMRAGSLELLCRQFTESDEFRAKLGRFQASLEWPAIEVRTDIDAQQAAAMTAHVEATWRGLGETDPFWSVLSVPQFRRDSFHEHAEEFRQSGQADVARFQRFADRAGIDLSRFRRCLELGCGVGRLTRWLATLFSHVIATDISRSHLAILAQELQSSAIQTVLLDRPGMIDELPDFDVFFSLIVLQHNPPPVIAQMLRSILGKLQPGGIAYFQVPTYREGYQFDPDIYLRALPPAGEMEMHVIPQKIIFEIAAANRCSVLEVREDGYTGDINGISNTLFLQKRA